MALPITPDQIIAVAKFAFDLWKSCKAAKGQYEQVGKEVYAMRTVIELVHLECKNPKSIINLADNKEKTISRQLGIHIRNCKQALSAVDASLKRYSKMSVIDKAAWALWGHSEVADLESNLSSFATQLDNFVNGLALKGLGIVNENVSKLRLGIGRIEEALERNKGNDSAAVKEVMTHIRRSGISFDEAKKYETIFQEYAAETCSSAKIDQANQSHRAQTPDPPRGRDKASDHLNVPKPIHRSRSTKSESGKQAGAKKSPQVTSAGSSQRQKPKYSLECWLIQIKTTEALFVTFQFSEKQKQVRGQWKLEEMAKQFRSLSQNSKLTGDHDIVKWVLEDRKKHEKNPSFTWHSYAGKIERKNTIHLGLGVEEQAMVIIKRQLTAAAQKKADEKKRLASKSRPGKKDSAKKTEDIDSQEKPDAKGKATARKNKDHLGSGQNNKNKPGTGSQSKKSNPKSEVSVHKTPPKPKEAEMKHKEGDA